VFLQNSNLSALRKSFLANEDITGAEVRAEILESWRRSKSSGVDPFSFQLPSPIPLEKAFSHKKWLYRKMVMQEYFDRLIALLQETNSVLYWVRQDLTILYGFGNDALLKDLQAINLDVGTNLSESLIGTNAMALAALTKSDAYVVGAEHYMAALQNYASSAVPFSDETEEGIYGYSFVITNASNFNIYQHNLLFFYSGLAKTQVNLGMSSTELYMKNSLSNLSLDQHKQGLLLINHKGLILRANTWFLSNLDLDEADIRGNFLKDLFPELMDVFNTVQTQKSVRLREIHFHKLKKTEKSFFVEAQQLKINDRVIGFSIFLHDKKTVYYMVNKVANYNAHFYFEDLIGASSLFNNAKTMAIQASLSNSNILLTGESGTGKELFAQAIHNESRRSNGPFISVNCAAIPTELIGSELFGYVEGAFTGARKGGNSGKFELANKGTIFLDEVGEMPLSMQSVLLRVLEDKKITRLGSGQSYPMDVRVIAATNINLLEAIDSKEFRLDLYYRLNVIDIELPSLRDRVEDIPLLIEYHIKQFNIALNKNIHSVSPEAMYLLQRYSWPGNIRELRNVIERAVNLASSSVLTVADLPKSITSSNITATIANCENNTANQQLIREFEQKVAERNRIVELMQKYNGNKARVAKELGITRASLYRRLRSMEQP
jgi:Transcriptional regulator containing PAS, AAA-type ATPase, and DNA-binding domains